MSELEKNRPWLSIVIPIYNAEKYLNKCLDSISRQTFKNFEVLLIDDGSTDSSSNICESFFSKDERFKYFKKLNGGSYQTRIFGAEKATGEYVSFCDADDYYVSKDAFNRMYEILCIEKSSMLQFGHRKIYNHLHRNVMTVNKNITIHNEKFLLQEYPKLVCSYFDVSHLTTTVWDKVYKADLLLNLPRSDSAERIFMGDDVIMNLHLLSNCDSVTIVPDVLYCYRQFVGASTKFSKTAMKDLDSIKKYQLSYLKMYTGDLREKIESTLFSELACWFYLHVRQAINHLSEEEVDMMINESLNYSTFKQARDYYLDNPDKDWEAFVLLREANASLYIATSKNISSKSSIKDVIRTILKQIYYRI